MNLFTLLAPVFFVLFPSLFLVPRNIEAEEIPLGIFFLTLFFIALGVFALSLCTQYVIKEKSKAIILVSLAVITVCYYGFFYNIAYIHLGSASFGRHRYMIPFWILSFCVAGFFVWKSKRNFYSVSKIIGIFAFVLFLLSSVSFAFNVSKKFSHIGSVTTQKENSILLPSKMKPLLGYLPDVYYIVPDAYANSKVLEEFFGYNNQEFLTYLRGRGFAIPTESKSNYSSTLFSIPSTLNMQYGDALIPEFSSGSSLPARRELLEKSKVESLFKSLGYAYVGIGSDNTTFTGRTADVRFIPNLLSDIMMKLTLFDPFLTRDRSKIIDAFAAFDKAVAIRGPKFVFAHILSPHDPYVFGPNGENIGYNSGAARSPDDMKLYSGQVQFVNKKLEETIDAILRVSSQPPIIIIQSDHGVMLPDSYGQEIVHGERFKNFSAFLLPGGVANFLPQSMENINTFRFIFDHYFGASFGVLEYKSFWSSNSH